MARKVTGKKGGESCIESSSRQTNQQDVQSGRWFGAFAA